MGQACRNLTKLMPWFTPNSAGCVLASYFPQRQLGGSSEAVLSLQFQGRKVSAPSPPVERLTLVHIPSNIFHTHFVS